MQYENISQFQKKYFGFLLLILGVVAIGLGSVVLVNQIKAGKYIGQEVNDNHQITVSGVAKKYVKPDLALVNFAVKTEGKTVAEAMEENTDKMNEVISVLKGLNIAAKDIQTTNFDLSPRYEWNRENEIFPSGKRYLVGYEVRQSLQVKVRNLNRLGEVIDKASEAGANQIGSFQLTFDRPEVLEKQVRLQAIQEAQAEARSLARQLGVRLGKVINISFGTTSPQPLFRTLGANSVEEDKASPQIEIGQNLIQVTAHITYQIN